MSLAGFEATVLESEWPQTHAVDSAVNGIGHQYIRDYSQK